MIILMTFLIIISVGITGCTSSSLPPIPFTTMQSNADRLFEQGKYAEAIKEYKNEIAKNPSTDAKNYAWAQIGSSNHNLGLEEEAVSAYKTAISYDDSDASDWNNMGLSLSNLNRPQEALDAFNKAIELDPKNTAYWTMQGNTLDHLGRYKDAIASYDRALNLDPNNRLAYENKQMVARKIGS